jgi:uncharacterized protein
MRHIAIHGVKCRQIKASSVCRVNMNRPSSPESNAPSDPLRGLAAALDSRGPAPVNSWNPPYCGEIDMRIARDGTWFYNGTPIGRPALVKLFASVLRKDPERFVLVTPVERVGIKVEDAPFLGVELLRDDLWALVKRALFYDLVAWGEARFVEGEEMFGVGSKGAFFAMAPVREIADRT